MGYHRNSGSKSLEAGISRWEEDMGGIGRGAMRSQPKRRTEHIWGKGGGCCGGRPVGSSRA